MPRKLKIALPFLALSLLTLAIWLLEPPYRRWSTQRAADAAQRSLSLTNYADAALSARRALQIDSNCVSACAVLAELLERSRSPRAVQWRQRVADLEPRNDSNHLALARTALFFDQHDLARQALASLTPQMQRTNSEVHDLSAQLAFARHDLDGAERHLAESCRLNPTNAVHACNLEIVRLHSSNSNIVQAARARLDGIRADPIYGAAVLRALARESFMRGDLDRAEQRSKELQTRSDHEFPDLLLHLTILSSAECGVRSAEFDVQRPGSEVQRSAFNVQEDAVERVPTNIQEGPPTHRRTDNRHTAFTAALTAAELEAGSDPDRINLLASWLNGHGYADLASAWLESFPDDTRHTTPVRLAETESYLARQQWAELRSMLEHSQWDADEHLRRALLALVYRHNGDEDRARAEWKHALRVANAGANQSRLALLRLAGAWSWEEESEDLLWSLAGRGPENRWALALLRQAYEMGRDTRALARVFQAMLRSNPGDPVLQNNLAATSLLLRTNLAAAHQLAQEAFSAQPTNASMTCTYAYSMHLQGRTEEGIRLLSKLPESQIQSPSTAAYYGLLLSATGDKAALKYLSIAKKGSLLPEEREFVERQLDH